MINGEVGFKNVWLQLDSWFSLMGPQKVSSLPTWVFIRDTHFLPSSVIVGEALSKMISKAEGSGLVQEFQLSQGTPMISHLQFADDTLNFCDAKKEDIMNVKVTSCALKPSQA